MRAQHEHTRSSDDEADQLEQPLPYERSLGEFLHSVFQDQAARVQQGIPYTPDWDSRYLSKSLRARDGSALTVRQTNWRLHRPSSGGDATDGVWQGVINADPDGVVRPRYLVTVTGSDTFVSNADGTIDLPAKETHSYNIVVDGDRTHVYGWAAAPPSADGRPVLRQPVPVDPATAEQLVTLLYTSTPA